MLTNSNEYGIIIIERERYYTKEKNKKFFQKGIDKHQNIMYNLIKEKEKRGNKDDE